MRIGAITRAAILAAVPLMLSGCGLLFGGMYPGFNPLAPPFAPDPFINPGAGATYDRGTADLEITHEDGTTESLTLGRIGFIGEYDESFGASASWVNDDGWELTVFAYDVADSLGNELGVINGDATFSRSKGMDYWSAGSYVGGGGNPCAVDVWEMTEKEFTGRVTCTSLRWTTYSMTGEEEAVEGEDPFEVTVTFGATSTADSPTS